MKTEFFTFLRGATLALAASLGLFAQSGPGPHPDDPASRPRLRIVEPVDGATFPQGLPVKVRAELSTNPPSEAQVFVYADGSLVGRADALPQITIVPPPPPAFAFTWTNPPVGRHEVYTMARYWGGSGFAPTIILSPTVEIEVTRSPEPTNTIPIVTVRALREEIAEGSGPNSVFELRRTGSLDRSLVVQFDLGGTATRGTDYAIPFNRTSVEFARGSATAEVIVRPALDRLVEGRESVVIEIPAPNIPTVVGAVPPYMPGEPSRAETDIVDAPLPPPPASIVWTAPADGSRYDAGDTVHFRAVATDPTGYLPYVEFFAYRGDTTNFIKIGESRITFITPPADGTPIAHELEWISTNSYAGPNRIVARARREDGQDDSRDVASLPLTVLIAERVPSDPTLIWRAPENGDHFDFGSTVHLRLVATDPAGYLPHVEFFSYKAGTSNSVKIGDSILSFLVAPTNGTPIVHELDWVTTNAFSGANRLLARAVTADGSTVVSRYLTVFIDQEQPVPTVAIRVEDGSASEADPAHRFVFRLSRSGPVDEPLTVYFSSRGSAVRGYPTAFQREVDYWLELNPCDLCAVVPTPINGNEVVIPAGASEVRIGGRVVDDDLVEGDESAIVRLIPGIPPNVEQARPFYQVEDGLEEAEAVIHDNDTALQLPVVSIRALDDEASETNSSDTIVFEVSRSGPTNETIFVNYLPTGSAQYLVDYRRTSDPTNTDLSVILVGPFIVEIPAGRTNALLELVARPDDRREGDETVVVNLTHRIPLPTERLRPTYEIGTPAAARAVIYDTPLVEQPAPFVSIIATDDSATEPARRARGDTGAFTLVRTGPTNRAVVVGYTVAGTARNGRDYEYLDGDATIPAGATSREIQVVPLRDDHDEGDETVVLTLRSGRGYQITDGTNATVVIHDASTQTNADPTLVINTPVDDTRFQAPTNVVIDVTAIDPQGDIRRVEFYANNRLLGVSEQLVRAAVAPGTPIHHGITWTNPAAGAYRLVARTVVGNLEVRSDGVDIAVIPALEPPASIPHPAETAPEDFVLTADEVSAYATAWRNGAAWSNRPTVIPPSFVARAGYLLQSGGSYEYRPRFRAPLSWGPVAGTNDVSTDSSGKARATLAKEEHPVQTVLANTTLGGYVDTSAWYDFEVDPSIFWPEGVVDRAPLSFAIAEVAASGSSSNSFAVTLRLLPATGVKAQVVEFTVGAGVTVTNISDAGVFDPAAGVIRWGPFYDDANRRLTVSISGASPRHFGGVASFDGYDTGVRVTGALPADERGHGPRIASIETRTDGAVQVLVIDDEDAAIGSATVRHSLEVSNDLRTWRRVVDADADSNGAVHVDPDAIEDAFRYYRVITE